MQQTDERTDERALAGLANVAALTFLAARAVPGGFWVALLGGVPLARAAQRRGRSAGYAAALASLIETSALMGPARLGIAMPHAASAPALGSLYARGARFLWLALTGAAVRFAYYMVTTAFYVAVLIGLDAYVGTYERVRDVLAFLPSGQAAAVGATVLGLALWSAGAGVIQAWVLRRGLRRWPAGSPAEATPPTDRGARSRPRVEPRAVVATATLAFALTLLSTAPWALGLVAAWLTVAWVLARCGARSLLGGLALAAPLALSTLGFALAGGIGLELGARRAARVALLVLVAVWLRAAAGEEGLRAVSVLLVRRLRRVRTVALAGLVLGASAGAADFAGSARRLGARLRSARKRPAQVVDAVIDWVGDEGARLPVRARPAPRFAWDRRSTALVLAAVALAAATAVVALPVH